MGTGPLNRLTDLAPRGHHRTVAGMNIRNVVCRATFLAVIAGPLPLLPQQAVQAPLPEIHQLMREVQEHQKQLDKIRENYTYTSYQVVQDVDANGQVKKTQASEYN